VAEPLTVTLFHGVRLLLDRNLLLDLESNGIGVLPGSRPGSLDDGQQSSGAWRAENRYALPSSPHPIWRLSELRDKRAALPIQLVQKIGQTSSLAQSHQPRRNWLRRD
jgi:hypothetical protein